jgi:hypothetical protein
MILVGVPVAGGATLIGLGIVRWSDPVGLWLIVAGATLVLQFLTVWTLAYVLLKIDANLARTSVALHDHFEELQRQTVKLESIAENVQLSDAAKSLAHWEEEGNALRAAISAQIAKHDWESVLYLVSEMERRFGLTEEAARLREQLRHEQASFYHAEVGRALPLIERLFDSHEWERADQEISRLLNAFPKETRFVQLREELHRRREARKQELVRTFTEAVQRDDIDIDTGMQVLQELDNYLTREEAKELEASARKVVKGKLEQLGVRFRFAVTEERWRDALEVAVNITEEFPNSRIAQEVRERLNVLRERAGLPADVEVTSTGSAGGGQL